MTAEDFAAEEFRDNFNEERHTRIEARAEELRRPDGTCYAFSLDNVQEAMQNMPDDDYTKLKIHLTVPLASRYSGIGKALEAAIEGYWLEASFVVAEEQVG